MPGDTSAAASSTSRPSASSASSTNILRQHGYHLLERTSLTTQSLPSPVTSYEEAGYHEEEAEDDEEDGEKAAPDDEAGDIDDHEHGPPRPGYKLSLPIVFALAPPIGNWLTGGYHLRDLVLLLLLIFYLHQLIEAPWSLYRSARPRRSFPASALHIAATKSQLRSLELLLLTLCVLTPILNVLLLRSLASFTSSSPSASGQTTTTTTPISWFSTMLFGLITAIRPLRELVTRVSTHEVTTLRAQLARLEKALAELTARDEALYAYVEDALTPLEKGVRRVKRREGKLKSNVKKQQEVIVSGSNPGTGGKGKGKGKSRMNTIFVPAAGVGGGGGIGHGAQEAAKSIIRSWFGSGEAASAPPLSPLQTNGFGGAGNGNANGKGEKSDAGFDTRGGGRRGTPNRSILPSFPPLAIRPTTNDTDTAPHHLPILTSPVPTPTIDKNEQRGTRGSSIWVHRSLPTMDVDVDAQPSPDVAISPTRWQGTGEAHSADYRQGRRRKRCIHPPRHPPTRHNPSIAYVPKPDFLPSRILLSHAPPSSASPSSAPSLLLPMPACFVRSESRVEYEVRLTATRGGGAAWSSSDSESVEGWSVELAGIRAGLGKEGGRNVMGLDAEWRRVAGRWSVGRNVTQAERKRLRPGSDDEEGGGEIGTARREEDGEREGQGQAAKGGDCRQSPPVSQLPTRLQSPRARMMGIVPSMSPAWSRSRGHMRPIGGARAGRMGRGLAKRTQWPPHRRGSKAQHRLRPLSRRLQATSVAASSPKVAGAAFSPSSLSPSHNPTIFFVDGRGRWVSLNSFVTTPTRVARLGVVVVAPSVLDWAVGKDTCLSDDADIAELSAEALPKPSEIQPTERKEFG
ncbi:hypothetical protein R3P38DRAFT_3353840 [Favolaschia claudopus]|uniref:Uncharacterized protein n=1 Tax=Favolaschia claudopus TaxID=2862362 RepID=A0AAW0BTC7_9AGAR